MPTYEFVCADCRKSFSLTLHVSEYEKRKSFKCPNCEGKHVRRKVTPFFALTSKKS